MNYFGTNTTHKMVYPTGLLYWQCTNFIFTQGIQTQDFQKGYTPLVSVPYTGTLTKSLASLVSRSSLGGFSTEVSPPATSSDTAKILDKWLREELLP
jgi:hypothetical protein